MYQVYSVVAALMNLYEPHGFVTLGSGWFTQV